MSFVRTLTATAILTTVGTALVVVPAAAAPVPTVQITQVAAARPADLATICVSSHTARADDSCRDDERKVALRVDRPIALCRAQGGTLTGGRCGKGERELTLPRNENGLLCATGRRGQLVHIERKADCEDGSVFRAINHVPGQPHRVRGPVAEGAGRVSVGLLSAQDPDLGDHLSFRIRNGEGDTDNDLFRIVGSELFLTESVTAAEHPILEVRIQTVDLLGKRRGRAMRIRVAATPTVQPTTFDLSPTSVTENAVAKVGTLTIADPDLATAPSFSVTAGGADLEIRNGSEVWTKRTLDHEAAPSVPVTIRVTDNGGVDLTRSFTVDVTDVDEDPTTIDLDGDTVIENTEAKIGTLSVDDPDADNAPVFTITTGGADLEIRNDDELWSTGLDFESDPSPSVGIHAGGTADLDEDFELTVTDANEAPTGLDLSGSILAENDPSGTEIGTLISSDPDAGDTAAYTLVSGAADNTMFAISGGKLVTAVDVDHEVTPTATARVEVKDAAGETLARTFTISVTDVNEAPATLTLADSFVPEHQPIGTAVGDLASTDPDVGDTRTFTLVSGTGDADNATFTIDGNTVRTAAVLDEATKSSYTVRVRVTDAGGLTRETPFAVTVDAINDAPTEMTLSSTSVAENAADPTVGTFSATDTDGPAPFAYALVTGSGDTDNGTFTIAGDTLSANGAFNFEGRTSYDIRVRVSDAGAPAQSFEKTFTINVTDVNEAPTSLTLPDTVVPEHQPIGTAVGDLASTDPDAGDTATYKLVPGTGSTDNLSFEIDGDTLRALAVLDEATKSSYAIRVRVTDAGGLTREATFTITVDAINDAPTALSLSPTSIAENAADNASVGTFSTTDTDGLAPYTYELVSGVGGADNDAFAIAGNTLTANSAFNLEVRSGYDIRVRVTDSGTPAQSFAESFTITVTNVNEAPTALTLSAATVAENASNGTTIGALASTDPDAGDTATYALVAGAVDNTKFAIASGQLVTAAGIDFEATPTLTARVRVTDPAGLTLVQDFAITVTNVNEAPTDLTLSAATIAENMPGGTTIGSVSGTDPDQSDTVTYSLVVGAADNTMFNLSNGGVLRAQTPYDHEASPTLTARVRVTDAGGLTFEKNLTITVTDVNEAPTNLSLSNTAIDENQPADTPVGDFSATDPDAGSTFSYALAAGTGDTDNASFTIVAGQLRTTSSFNFEAGSSHDIRVRVTDADGQLFEKSLSINVTDVNEAPNQLDLSGTAIDENQPTGTPVGDFSATDPDAGSTFSYALAAGTGDTDNASFTIVAGQLRTTSSFNFEAKSSYAIRVRVTDDGTPALSLEQTFTITVNNVNDAPTVAADSYGTAIGNTLAKFGSVSPSGPVVTLTGALPLLNDSDEDGNSISVVAGTYTGNAGGSLTIDGGGAFTYLPQVGDAGLTDTVTYPVTDGTANSTATLDIAIGTRRIWWVDDTAPGAPGTGLSTTPFTSLTPLNAAATDVDAANDEIFVYAGTYSTGLVLEAGQTLTGEGRGLTGLVAAGARPTISAGGTTAALALSNSTLVRGLNLTSSGTGAAISGNGASSALVASDVTATGGTGYAVDIATVPSVTNLDIDATVIGGIGGAVRVSSISSGTIDFTGPVTQATAGNPRGIDVSANTGAVTTFTGIVTLTTGTTDAITYSGGGTLALDNTSNQVTTTTGTAISVGTGAGNLRAAGMVTSNNATGQPLKVVSHSGGTLDVSARLVGSGVTMTSSGATVNLTGRLTLSTTTAGAVGLAASGGGTITAPHVANTVSTTTGTAVNIVGTSIGAGHVVFESVSSSGATNGINVQDTGTAAGNGSFKVLGTGATTTCGGDVATGTNTPASLTSSPNPNTCTGGVILGSTASGVRLVNTKAPSLSSLRVQDSKGDGVELAAISGSGRISDTWILGNGDASGDNGVDVTGSVSAIGDITLVDSTVENSYDSNVTLTAHTSLVVSKSYLTKAGFRGGASGDGVQATARGTGSPSLQVLDSVLTDNLGDHVEVSASENATMNQTVIERSLMTTSATAVGAGALGGGIVVATSGIDWFRDLAFGISYNAIRGARTSAITISQSGTTTGARLHGTVAWNTIGGSGVDSCAVAGASGVDIRNRDGAGALVADVSDNTISQCSGPAISVRALGGPVVTDIKASANTISQENGTGTAQRAFRATFNTSITETTNSSCLDLSNTSQAGPAANSIVVQANSGIATKLVGYVSGSAGTFLSSRNSDIPATTIGAFAGASSCQTP